MKRLFAQWFPAIESQPAPCPPHTPGTSGEWIGKCTKCGAPC